MYQNRNGFITVNELFITCTLHLHLMRNILYSAPPINMTYIYKNTYSIPKFSNYYTNHALIFAPSDKISVLSDADAE